MKIADTSALQNLDHDIWWALSGARVAQRRIDAVAAALERRRRIDVRLEKDARRYRQEAVDLKIHLRDRDRHVANLEAMLRPLMEPQGVIEIRGEQDSLL